MGNELLETAVEAARKAGEILVQRLDAHRDIAVKGLRDLVTDADLAAEEAILELITRRFPQHSIYSEESPFREGSSPCIWLIDPLDGTTNYSHRFPCFATSIALLEGNDVILGVVYEPLGKRLFTAQKGNGAYLNGHPLRVSSISQPLRSLIGMDWPRSQDMRKRVLEVLSKLALEVGTIRVMGAASLGFCFVAAGWLEAYFHPSLKPWDAAAGVLLVQEAGGEVTDFRGNQWDTAEKGAVASNGLFHRELVKHLSRL